MKKIFPLIVLAFLLLQLPGFIQGATIPTSERAALVALYNSTNGDSWTNNSGWKTPPLHTDGFAMPGTEGGWYGITVSAGRVTVIYQTSNQLSGTIPSQLGDLGNLQILYLNSNQLSGNIPSQLGNLKKCSTLWLDRNQLTGSIPSQLGNMSNLQWLFLNNNQLTGSIPSQLGNLSNLTNLFLQENQLSGSIPSQLGNLSKLGGLNLSSNQLSGAIPSQLGNLEELYNLDLASNQLSGSIPSQLGNLGELLSLNLKSNQLTGTIPTSLTNLEKLTSLDIGYNCLSTTDTTLKNWLKTHDPDWQTTQCLTLPEVTTSAISSITSSGAVSGGNVTSDGNATVTEKGVCWNLTDYPTVDNFRTLDGSGKGSFTSNLTDLTANRKYYVRAYATNSVGTAYGSTKTFTSLSNLPEADPPFGSFDTPLDGSTVSGSISITGWALDDGGLASVKIYLTQGDTQTYIGDALLVEGARTDVAAAYPDYPGNTKAGWGYMMLTNFLPGGGNGTYVISAIATDLVDKTTTLGSKTIIVDNANAVKPFGAIDTPSQGGTAMGSSYVNWGWALTPQPNSIATNGSTINVWVDGAAKGHPVYNLYRSDLSMLFPGYANTNGAAGYYKLDTTKFSDGVHTIFWIASDNGGNSDGIGSRYFTIQNSTPGSAETAPTSTIETNLQHLAALPRDHSQPVKFSKGFNSDNDCQELLPDETGNNRLVIKELERVEIKLSEGDMDIQGYLISGDELAHLPIGSTLDAKNGTFSWIPGPGFLGRYSLVFVLTDTNGQSFKKLVEIKIEPKFNGRQ
jgi:Leucine-rich repeat (LRR) protein